MIPTTLCAEEPKDLKVIATLTDWGGRIEHKKEDSGIVIRSAEELFANSKKDPTSKKDPATPKAMEAELAKFLKVDSIDWDKQMIVAVNGHKVGSGSIKFESLKTQDKVLTVTWKLEERPALGFSIPAGLVLAERFDGEVKFVQAMKK